MIPQSHSSPHTQKQHLDRFIHFGKAQQKTLDAFHKKCLRQLLGIRRYDRVRNDKVLQRTGLTSLSHLLSRRRISVFVHVARLENDTHRQTWLFSSTSTYHSTDLLTARGVVHGTSGSTSYETIPTVRLETSGGVLLTVDTVVQRRDGPRRLRDNDDDDDVEDTHTHTRLS